MSALLFADGFVGVADGSTPLVHNGDIDARQYAELALARSARTEMMI